METKPRIACHVIIFNIGKKHNVGTISRCCTAFDVESICLVGSRQFNTFGSHGADAHVRMRHFTTLEECCNSLKENGCKIVGIEIVEGAKPVHTDPFYGPTAFMLGNEGQGLSSRQKQMCDYCVYISQYGPGTASLNVAVACSIVLHRFAVWAGYPERGREGEKYVVDDRPQREGARGTVPLTPEERSLLRQSRQAPVSEADEDAASESLAQLLGDSHAWEASDGK